MKTAISIPDDIFEEAERAAKRLGVSRSELFTQAVKSFLATRMERNVTESYNLAFGHSEPDELERWRQETARRTLLSVEWED